MYREEFTIDTGDIAKDERITEGTALCFFEADEEGDIWEVGVVAINGRIPTVMQALGTDYGLLHKVSEEEWQATLKHWDNLAKESRAENRASAVTSRHERMADMGMDVPAR